MSVCVGALGVLVCSVVTVGVLFMFSVLTVRFRGTRFPREASTLVHLCPGAQAPASHTARVASQGEAVQQRMCFTGCWVRQCYASLHPCLHPAQTCHLVCMSSETALDLCMHVCVCICVCVSSGGRCTWEVVRKVQHL